MNFARPLSSTFRKTSLEAKMSIWKDMLEETVKQSSGKLLENQLPCDSSIVGKVRNAVTSSVFGIIVWQTIKAAK